LYLGRRYGKSSKHKCYQTIYISKGGITMKKVFTLITVLSITVMLLAGCAAPESAQTPDQTAPTITTPAPGQESPDSTPAPDQETPSTDPTPAQPVKSPGAESATGTLTVLVTDAPSYVVNNVTVHFSRVEIHRSADGSGGDVGWIEVPLAAPDGQTFDDSYQIILSETMGYVTLAQGQVPAGKYTQIRVYMESEPETEGEETGTWVAYTDPADPENEKRVEAKLASETLKFIRPFEVLPAADDGEGEGANTDIELDFDLQKSVVFTGATQSEDPKVIVKPVIKLAITMGGGDGDCDTDAELILENKDPDSDWAIIDEDGDEVYGNEDEQDIYGLLSYNTEGDEFCYDFKGYGLYDIEYSLIYYADFYEDDPEDRITTWGGNYPGALIASGFASDGYLELEGSINLREDLEASGIDLPWQPDGNIEDYAYDGEPDYYAHAHGAKIWLVPSDYYDPDTFEVTDWVPASFLFETDLITFDDTDNESEPLE
jgi:hypothetical protein